MGAVVVGRTRRRRRRRRRRWLRREARVRLSSSDPLVPTKASHAERLSHFLGCLIFNGINIFALILVVPV
jgi:hypothetical protein